MTVRKCDRCGRTISEGTGYRRYKISDCDPDTNYVLRRGIATQRAMVPLDLCSECYNKLMEFIRNEDVSRTYVLRGDE